MPGYANAAFCDGGAGSIVSVVTCRDAEIAAGAIALNEATAAEREGYRLHLSTCAGCVETFGGEREIERTAAIVARARDAETWQPATVPSFAPRRRFGSFGWGVACAAAALAVAAVVVIP